MKSKQQDFFKYDNMKAYGGELRTKANNRGQRPLVTTKNGKNASMHVVLRSTQAKGIYSFLNPRKRNKIDALINNLSKKHGIEILKFANVGNHIHLHIRIITRALYIAWIRGISSGLAMISMGLDGFKKLRLLNQSFWDQRPFSQIITAFGHFKTVSKYIDINKLEATGLSRPFAKELIQFVGKLIIYEKTYT